MWQMYNKSKPKKVKEGIKAQTKRGSFGTNWWAKRWIAALEAFNDAPRLQRGRSYARQGQVLSIEINKGCVTSKVQGSRSKPYTVKIEVEPLSPQTWQEVIKELSTQAIFAAKLLAGEMPQTIESVFDQTRYPLFPSTSDQLMTDCSCPDWSNPCKHIAATFYLLGEEFDRDPFLIFKLRGMNREDFITHLSTNAPSLLPPESPTLSEVEIDPLPGQPERFWEGAPLSEQFQLNNFTVPSTPATLPKSLGSFPFWRGQTPLQDHLSEIYQQSSKYTKELLMNTLEASQKE